MVTANSCFRISWHPILSMGHSAGEQRPLTLLSYLLEITFYGFLIISILTPIFFLEWFKKYWYLSVAIALISFLILF